MINIFPGSSGIENTFWSLINSWTRRKYNHRFSEAKKENPKFNAALDYINGRKNEFIVYLFLENNIQRYGETTNNAGEIKNSSIKPERSLPVVSMLDDIIRKKQ